MNSLLTSVQRPDANKMAPTTTIETITITRPLKVCMQQNPLHLTKIPLLTSFSLWQVIAFICGVIVVILMIMALASTDWLMADGWRQGLFVHCIEEDSQLPLPFNIQDPPGCYWTRDIGMYSYLPKKYEISQRRVL